MASHDHEPTAIASRCWSVCKLPIAILTFALGVSILDHGIALATEGGTLASGSAIGHVLLGLFVLGNALYLVGVRVRSVSRIWRASAVMLSRGR